ncbi:hypothetical protein OG607_44290 [Streptomyces sp. NBC_01537]|uniref:hypothetical protein n=1 Tax=Streptomyces sp. NBC_01537 TaxID=2903896 RepID=UPI00386B8073
MRFLKRPNRRAEHVDYVPDDDDEDDDESACGGYVISIEPQTPTMTLVEPIRTMRSEEFSVSVPSQELEPGVNYLLGGPGEPTCEVVQVAVDEPLPGQRRLIQRGRFRTVASAHPAGTLVTPVTAERIADWSQWMPVGGAE